MFAQLKANWLVVFKEVLRGALAASFIPFGLRNNTANGQQRKPFQLVTVRRGVHLVISRFRF